MRSVGLMFRLVMLWGASLMLSTHALASDSLPVTFYTESKFLLENIEQEPYQATSTAVDTVRMLLDELDYTQPLEYISLARAFAHIEAGEPVCVINKIRNPIREQKFAISLPQNFYQSVRLYQLAELSPIATSLLNEQDQIENLHKALESFPSAAIILPRDFSYGEALDADIAQANQEQIIRLPNDVYFDRFMQLFFKHKVGFALIFPSTYYRAMQYQSPVPIREYQVAGIPPITSGHVLCGNNEIGQQAIAAIDQATRAMYQKPEFLQAHLAFLPQQGHAPIQTVIEHIRQQN